MTTADASVRSPLDAARRLAPSIRQAADQIEEARELPRPLFEALADAGLFQMLLPRSLGGQELDLPTYVEVLEEIGKADASTAWAVNQGGVFATHAAVVPREIARRVWIDTPRSVVANMAMPSTTATPVDGGYRLSGQGGFSTGCRHSAWLAPRGRVMVDGEPRMRPNGQADIRFFLVRPRTPRSSTPGTYAACAAPAPTICASMICSCRRSGRSPSTRRSATSAGRSTWCPGP